MPPPTSTVSTTNSSSMTREELAQDQCTPRLGAGHRLSTVQRDALLALLPGWAHEGEAEGETVTKAFAFADYAATLAFVNAVACIARAQDHHPDITFGFNHCRIAYTTHSVGGLSLNDFICAAKIEALPRP